MTSSTLVNGEWTDSVSVYDRGLAFGDGLFETLRYQQGRMPLLPYHLDRLRLGCTRLRIPLDEEALGGALTALVGQLRQAGEPRALVKLMVTRGPGGRGYTPPPRAEVRPTLILQWRPLAETDPQAVAGVTLQPCHTPIFPNPLLAGLKHLNRLDYVLAAQELPEDASVQGLLLDACGKLLECLHHNLFLLVDGRLKTPRLAEAGVHGVMRRLLLEHLAPQAGLEVLAEDLDVTDLAAAGEVFICNSVRGIWPVRGCLAHSWPVPGDVTAYLQSQVDQLFGTQAVMP